MQSKWLGRVGLAALLIGVTSSSGLVGCAAERDPINRVQAGVVDKTFFLGADIADFHDDPEFRTKTYNIDSAANTDSFAGTIGGSSSIDRVRWEVTENLLLARRAYQESPGADNRGLPRQMVDGKLQFTTPPDGTIIAAYKIESHFDIRKDYNSQTGEETNVIVENSSDRPWNQRQFMRVDWSTNLAESTSGDTSWIFGAGTSASPIEYSPNNDDSPDRPNFEIENGYFDITNKYTMKSEEMPGWGISECVLISYFNQSTSWDCSPTEVKVRSSYVKLTGQEDFEPFEESMAQRDIVGNWGNAGSGMNRDYGPGPITSWDPQYGYTDAKTKTFYSIHDIWVKSHQAGTTCASNDDADTDGTADECDNGKTHYAGNAGSQCDLEVGKCTIPVRDREIKTIAYWINEDAPPELLDEVSSDGKTVTNMGAVEENGYTWNQILKASVATRREVECRRTHSGSRDECRQLYFKLDDSGKPVTDMIAFGGWGIEQTIPQASDKGKQVFVNCHNPVRAYDADVCGKPGDVIRLGDVRKNYQIYWPYASRAPYGGVATIGADPVTGEMLGETATIMMRSATYAAAQQRDIIQLALGDIDMSAVVDNAPATTYADAVKNGRVVGGLAQGKTAEQIRSAIDNIDQTRIKATLGEASLDALSLADRSLAKARLAARMNLSSGTIAKANDQVGALVQQIGATQYKTEVQNPTLYKVLGSIQDHSSPVYSAISKFAEMDTSRVGDLFDQYQAYLGNKGVCFYDSASTAGAGSVYQPSLAPYFKKLYGDLDKKARGEKIYQDLLRESVKGIAFHEIGHSLGLRHNFASSWDAMNYAPQYWQLRTNNGKSLGACTSPRNGGADTCMGPRYLDPLTDDEQGVTADEPRPAIEYFANTSTMEYQLERFGETVGAGQYDYHAMNTLYGRTLNTFDPTVVKNPSNFGVLTLSQGIPSDIVRTPAGYGAHYTTMARLANLFDPNRDCRDATEAEKSIAKWRVVHGKICASTPKIAVAYQDMKSGPVEIKVGKTTSPTGVDGVRNHGLDENGKDVYRWQYRYGEDYSAGGYMHAKMMDSGADEYEITLNTIRRFDVVYPWQYFRRQNKEFAWWSLPDAIGNRTFKRIRGYHWNTTVDIGRAAPGDLTDDDQARPAVMASVEMFNFLQRAILTPEPGAYTDTTTRTPLRSGALKIFDTPGADATAGMPTTGVGTIGIVDGRFVQVDVDNARGGSWDYNAFIKHAPFDDEKVLALRELVDSRPTLSTISRENALDGRDPYISFRTDTPQAIDRLVGALLSEDWETISPSLTKEGSLVPFDILAKDPTKLVRPAGSNIVFPNVGYSHELGVGIYGLLFSRFSTDMTLANKMRIRADGDAGPTIPVDRRQGFLDPNSGIRYLAIKFGTEQIQGRAVERGIGSRVLQRANELLQAAYQTQPNAVTGEPEAVLDGSGSPTIKDPTAEATLRRYVGLIDGLRQVGNIFGGGPLGGGGGGGGDDD